jgi:prepilin-type N-terminal cleavage/methylation domain-containing protein
MRAFSILGLLRRRSTMTQPLHRGFTLIEMLVVIAIISILLTAAGPVFDKLTSGQSPAAVASAVAGQLDRARTHAIAKNTYVWVRLGAVEEEPKDFFIGVYQSLDGTEKPDVANFKGVWTSPRFENFKLSNQLDPSFTSTLPEPAISPNAKPDQAVWIRFSPSGEAQTIDAIPTESRIKMRLPTATVADLTSWIELGLQPTRGGQVPESAKKDVAAVRIAGLTGQTLQFTR